MSGSSTHGSQTITTTTNDITTTTEYGEVNHVCINSSWADILTIPIPSHTISGNNTSANPDLIPDSDGVCDLQDITNTPVINELSSTTLAGPQDITSNDDSELTRSINIQLDRESARVKEICKNLGLPESVYSSNSDVYYPVLTPDHEDIDYINFKDIINKSWSIELDNMSSEDIQKELDYLKCQQTSSPKMTYTSITSSSEKDNQTTSNEDDVKKDPTYGLLRKRKVSKRPKRAPSAARIAVQKIILRTRGAKAELNSNAQTPNQTRLLRQKQTSQTHLLKELHPCLLWDPPSQRAQSHLHPLGKVPHLERSIL